MRSDYDLKRQQFIESQGIKVIRYTNDQVLGFRDGVIQNLIEELDELKNKQKI